MPRLPEDPIPIPSVIQWSELVRTYYDPPAIVRIDSPSPPSGTPVEPVPTLLCAECNQPIRSEYPYFFEEREYCRTCRNLFSFCGGCDVAGRISDFLSVSGDFFCTSCADEKLISCSICSRKEYRESMNFQDGKFVCRCTTPEYLKTNNLLTSKRRMGFEIEFFSKKAPSCISWGSFHGDGSIRPEWGSPREFASYIFAGDSMLQAVDTVCKAIAHVGGGVNYSCGLHIHFDVSQNTKTELFRIRKWWRYFEPMLYASVSKDRVMNQYCQSANLNGWSNDRYRSMNIAAINKHGTYEIRLHHGTLDASLIKNWILFLSSFFETFSNLPLTKKRLAAMETMNMRQMLIFLFQQTKIPLSLRKYFVRSLRRHGVGRISLAA